MKARSMGCSVLNLFGLSGVGIQIKHPSVKDVLEIITVFSARLYGSRSRKNQKPLDGVRQAVQATQT